MVVGEGVEGEEMGRQREEKLHIIRKIFTSHSPLPPAMSLAISGQTGEASESDRNPSEWLPGQSLLHLRISPVSQRRSSEAAGRRQQYLQAPLPSPTNAVTFSFSNTVLGLLLPGWWVCGRWCWIKARTVRWRAKEKSQHRVDRSVCSPLAQES